MARLFYVFCMLRTFTDGMGFFSDLCFYWLLTTVFSPVLWLGLNLALQSMEVFNCEKNYYFYNALLRRDSGSCLRHQLSVLTAITHALVLFVCIFYFLGYVLMLISLLLYLRRIDIQRGPRLIEFKFYGSWYAINMYYERTVHKTSSYIWRRVSMHRWRINH